MFDDGLSSENAFFFILKGTVKNTKYQVFYNNNFIVFRMAVKKWLLTFMKVFKLQAKHQAIKTLEKGEAELKGLLNPALDWYQWSASRPGRSAPEERSLSRI